MTPISIAAYLVLFGAVAFLFVLFSLVLGRLVRPSAPTPEKLETYECGEPAVGSSYVQFNLRFYVVALVFIIFEVEMAFFFPWAAVFGKLTRMLDPQISTAAAARIIEELTARPAAAGGAAQRQGAELKGTVPFSSDENRDSPPVASPPAALSATDIRQLALAAMVDIALFFAVLLVGFAYVWKRGDLDWVRAKARLPSLTDPATP